MPILSHAHDTGTIPRAAKPVKHGWRSRRRLQGVIVEGLSWYFAACNRNKRSIVLNLRSAAGIEALHRLIASADVVVDNFRPGVMAELGLD